MSANNWAVCPRCTAEQSRDRKQRIEKARASYGRVTPEEYDKLKREAEEPFVLTQNLREDYELGVDEDGNFSVNYRCHCQQCRFSFSYIEETVAFSPTSNTSQGDES